MEPPALPSPCLVVLCGPGGAGKSTWAAAHFRPHEIVSSDALRAAVGTGEDDMRASRDAFAVLDDIVARRLRRGLTTVVDTLGTETTRRSRLRAAAAEAGLPCVAVVLDTPPAECRRRNALRHRQIPAYVLNSQLGSWPAHRELIVAEPFDRVVTVAAEAVAAPKPAAVRSGLRFGLHLGRFDNNGRTSGAATLGADVRRVAVEAEEAGFDAVYVMDHFRQIPQVGRAWEDFPESWTTLAWIAACTERVRVGTLVSGVTYRNPAHLAKIAATLDVLSGGRAVCGVGLGWFEQEHRAYGWEFPPVAERYRLLEDTLRLLPVMWGKGAPAFAGDVVSAPETLCYPRPLGRIPVIVGGGGEHRTLRLAARYADAANVFGGPEVLRHKAAVLRAHCEEAGRDPAEVELTQLSTATSGAPAAEQAAAFRALHEAGASEVMVRLPDVWEPGALERFAAVIAALR